MHRSFYCLCLLLFACVRSQNVEKIEKLIANFSLYEQMFWKVFNYSRSDATRIPDLTKALEFYEIYMDVDFGEIGIFQMISKEWLNDIHRDYDAFRLSRLIEHMATVNSTFSQAFTLVKAKNYPDILKFAAELEMDTFRLLSIFLSGEQDVFFRNLVQNISRICDNNTKYILAESQVEREVYKEILANFLKAYIILEFTSAIERNTIYAVRERESLRSAIRNFKYDVTNYEYYNDYKRISKNLSREMWACDPNDFKLPDKTDSFLEVSMPYQGFISNEMNLNGNRNCRQSCSDYANTSQFICDENSSCPGKDSVKKELLCRGLVQNCATMHDDMTVCMAPSNSSRRYDFIKFDDGRVIGIEKHCSNELRLVSHWHWFHKCDNCLCYCNEEDNTSSNVGSHFSLREVTTDIDQNLVVTGVGITTVNGVIQLTILQQKLLPNGLLNTTKDQQNSNWITSPPLNISGYKALIENRDYVSVTWQSGSIALTSVTIKDNDHVVTGVRFCKLGGHIRVEIRATQYDFERGMLIDVADSFWMGNTNLLNELKLERPDVPTKSSKKSQMFAENNEFVQFQPSDIEKDGAQSTVPYLDTSTVQAYIPLSGIGLYYKSTPGSGGFIAPKLITFNFGRITKY